MTSIYKRNLLDDADIIFAFMAMFAYYFQFPFRNISSLIVPATLALLVLNLKSAVRSFNFQTFAFYSLYCIYIAFCVFNAAVHGTAFSRILRFFVICVAIPLCFNIEFSQRQKNIVYKIFMVLSVLKTVVIIALGVWCVVTGGWQIIRRWVLDNNLGDIYPSSYFIPKIQIVGNPLIVFAFIMHYTKTGKFDLLSVLLIVGIVFAGNFAFLLGLFCFFAYKIYRLLLSRKNKNGYLTPVVLVLLGIFFTAFLSFSLNQMKVKQDYSNAVRVQQIQVLTDCNFFIGEGLGNSVKADAGLRQYDGDIYFEVQTFYIFNQVGVIGLLLFYILTIYQSYKAGKGNIDCLILYLVYLMYSFWNPYCFDSTHMLVVLILNNFNFGGGDRERKLSCNSLLSD